MNLSQALQNNSYSFFFLIVENYLDINLHPYLNNFYPIYAYKNNSHKLLASQKIPYFCLEEQGISLEQKNSGRLLSHPKTIEYINQICQQSKTQAAIVPFKPSARIEKLCQQHSWKLIANPAKINRFFEDKIQFQKICDEHQLPTIPSQIITLNPQNFDKTQSELGKNLVLQTHFGWAGNSTFMVSSYQEAISHAPQNSPVKLSTYLIGYSLLNNCCLTPKGLIQSPPALQYTGITPFTSNPFATVGRQWPSLAPNHITSQINSLTQQFSRILQQHKYLGFFGLDFFVSQDQVFILECNPRLTASFALYTYMEISQNINPLFYFHLLAFTNPQFEFDISKELSRFENHQLVGSEIIFKNSKTKTYQKISQNIPFSDSLNPIKIKPHILSLFKPE
jgi:predicted ATP-grasp superfamily ATP-dependent carboligase